MGRTPPLAPGYHDLAGATERFRLPKVAPSASTMDRLASACSEVSTEPVELGAAALDWWPISIRWTLDALVPSRPAVIARPHSAGEVAAVLDICNREHLPVTASAGRSGVCGASIPLFGGVVLDTTALSGLAEVDEASLTAVAAPGIFGPELEEGLRLEGYTLGHFPQSFDISTLGGWLACRSAGQYSTRYGKIEDMVRSLEVALADGSLIRTAPKAPRSATGPDLTQLFVGSEGTLGIITEATLVVHPVPTTELRRAWLFPSFAAGVEAARLILRRGATPAVLRLYDPAESVMHFGIEGGAVMILLDEAEEGLALWTVGAAAEEAARLGAGDLGDAVVAKWLEKRNDVSALAAFYRSGLVVDTIEVAAPWSALPGLYTRCCEALLSVDGTLHASAHLSHSYPDGGCVYMTFAGKPDSETGGSTAAELYYNSAWDAVMSTLQASGGAISHHHGIGIHRGPHLRRSMGPAWKVLRLIKDSLDPAGILNPGKLGMASHLGETPWP